MGEVVPIHIQDETPEQALAEREAGDLPDDVDPCTDLANAYRLAQLHEGDLLFARSLGWLAWDGRRYAQDELGLPSRCAQDVARSIRCESAGIKKRAAKAVSDELRKILAKRSDRLWQWAWKSQQARSLRNMLEVAQSLPSFAVLPDVFDADPMLLNVANGTVDLRTGRVRDHLRNDRITKVGGAGLLEAECPTWLAFLGRIFNDNEEVIGFVKRAIGYSLTGLTDEQCFFLLWGTGANGKSTLLEVLRYVLGDYALNTSADTLMSQRGGRGPENDVARLRGARLVTASESGERRQLDEERVKRLTGGDTYTARFLHKEFFEYKPAFKLWLACNNKPKIEGTDHGMWRRVRFLKFGVTIPDEEKDPAMPRKLIDEAPGILRWAVEGCICWQREGLRPPPEVLEATMTYRAEEDVLGRFLDDECTILAQARVKTGHLYERYVRWCQEGGEHPMTKRKLGSRLMEDERFRDDRNSAGRWWVGLGLNAEEDRGHDA